MVLNYTVFDGAIYYLMVLPQVRMVLRKEEFFPRGFCNVYNDDVSIALSNSNMAAPLEDVQSIICLI